MGKITVPVTEELISLNPDANLETVLGETITVDAPGFGAQDPAVTTADADLVGGQPPKGPKVTD